MPNVRSWNNRCELQQHIYETSLVSKQPKKKSNHMNNYQQHEGSTITSTNMQQYCSNKKIIGVIAAKHV